MAEGRAPRVRRVPVSPPAGKQRRERDAGPRASPRRGGRGCARRGRPGAGGVQKRGRRVRWRPDQGEGPEGCGGLGGAGEGEAATPAPGRALGRTPPSWLPRLPAGPLLPRASAGPAALTSPAARQRSLRVTAAAARRALLPPAAPAPPPPPRRRPQLAPSQGPARCCVPQLRRRTPRRRSLAALLD